MSLKQCEHGFGSRNHCSKTAVGKATDQYGTNYYCEKHLQELEKMVPKNVTIERFYKKKFEGAV